MSIIGRPSMRDAVSFFEKGLRATESVVLLSSTRSGVVHASGTGWLVTPRLVLTMSHVVSTGKFPEDDSLEATWASGIGTPGRRARARLAWKGDGARFPLLEGPDIGISHLDVALLELEDAPSSYRLLGLQLGPLEFPDDVYVLQYNHGNPVLLHSIGELFDEKEGLLFHDADTQIGASGAPLFNEDWQVIGVHAGGGHPLPAIGRPSPANFGLALPWVVERLRKAPQWEEIATIHRLVRHGVSVAYTSNSQSTRDVLPDAVLGSKPPLKEQAERTMVLRAAAVRWSFAPEDLHPSARRLLATEVSDPDAPQWSLRSEVRARVVRATSLEELRASRGDAPAQDAEQRVIDRILQGPPFRVDEIPEAELPSWIPAVRWFNGTVSGLPQVQQISSELEARRLRGRLQRVVGPRFAGRTEELARLNEWRSSGHGPFVVSGPGGVGKSALIARFILEASTPFVWLDFDSAELAPDDAPTLLTEMLSQLHIQLPTFPDEKLLVENWRKGVEDLSTELAQHGVELLILVLDSFEAAQYEGRHAELWPFLEELSAWMPGLRVIVSGRVPLPHLMLGGVAAGTLHLTALNDVSARAWLEQEGIHAPAVVTTILTVTRRLPLNLRLAIELVKKGDTLEDLSKTLPEQLIQGYLYRRILRRVSSESLQRLARGALVLRRLTADMLYPVLGKACSLDEQKAREDFTSLAGELSLVEGTTVLRHRPDVRNAVLHLLEAEDVEWVASIEREAVRWYAAQDTRDPDIATELVYHRLRLGDFSGATQAWVPGVATRMGSFALEELPEPGQNWLAPRLKPLSPSEVALEEWERDASARIRDAIERKLWRAVKGILEERTERSAHSPLIFLEAYALWKHDKPEQAMAVLESAVPTSGPTGRDRAVLLACLAEEAGRKNEANRLLEPLSHDEAWADRREPVLELMAVFAARVRLLVDLEAEERFAAFSTDFPSVRRLVSAADLVLPYIQASHGWPEAGLKVDVESLRRWSSRGQYESVQFQYVLGGPPECQVIHRIVEKALERIDGHRIELVLRTLLTPVRSAVQATEQGSSNEHRGWSDEALAIALELVWRATLRWRLLRKKPLLNFIYDLASSSSLETDVELTPSILAQAAPFSSPSLLIEGPKGPIHKPISNWLLKHGFPGGMNLSRVRELFSRIGHPLPSLSRKTDVEVAEILIRKLRKAHRPHWILATLHLAAPSPLPRLVERLVEMPD